MVKRYHHKTVPGMVVEYEVVPNGIFVNWSDYDAELALWKSNHAFASKLADDLTQDGIKDRARIRDLEAALRDMVEAAEVGKVFTSGSRINPVLLKARNALTALETGAKPIERTEVCKHYATVENCPMCSPKSEDSKHG